MKKGLFLLPLLAGVLAGCEFTAPWVKGGGSDNGGGNGGGGGGNTANTVVLDFSAGEIETDFIDDLATNKPFTVGDMTYNDVGCWDASYSENYYLNFGLKKIAGDGQVAAGESFPFIGNAEAFGKAIKSIDIVVSAQTGGIDFYVDFPSSAVTSVKAGQVAGEKHSVAASKESTFSVTNSGSSKYFTIAAGKDVGAYRKNGAIKTITIHF